MTATTRPGTPETPETPEPPVSGPPGPRRPRGRYVAAVVVCVVAVVAIVALTVVLSSNVVYFRTVGEAVNERTELGMSRFRLAGEVVAGSIEETSTGVRFEVTDGDATAVVVHRGDPPELFEDGAPVVCEGRWSDVGPGFASDRIMIKHGEEYRPPDVDAEDAPAADAR